MILKPLNVVLSKLSERILTFYTFNLVLVKSNVYILKLEDR